MPLTLWQQSLARELRRLRELTDTTQARAAKDLGWSPAKLSTVEGANVALSEDDLTKLLDLYGVVGRQRESLMGMNQAQRGGWYDLYRDVLPGDALEYLRMEAQAEHISTYDATPLLNGLLQTEGYAREVIRVMAIGRLSADEIERRVEVRMRRQEALTRTKEPIQLRAALASHVLSWEVGGPGLMEEQREHLRRLTERSNVDIRLVSPSTGAHPGMGESFIRLAFPVDHVPDVVYLEGLGENRYVIEPSTVEAYRVAFDQLWALSAPMPD